MVNVENCQFLKENCKFLSVIWVKWKQSVCSITLLYSSTFYSLFLAFFVLEIFKFKYDKVFVRYSASISKFEWSEQLRFIAGSRQYWLLTIHQWWLRKRHDKNSVPTFNFFELSNKDTLRFSQGYVTNQKLICGKVRAILLWWRIDLPYV